MAEFTITMRRSAEMNEEERRRRLYQAYQVILRATRREREFRDDNSCASETASADQDDEKRAQAVRSDDVEQPKVGSQR